MFLLSLKVDLDVIPIFVVVVVVFIAFLDVSKLWSCLWFLFMIRSLVLLGKDQL